jgi:sugar/nucleoside kinase (ribokinase family)
VRADVAHAIADAGSGDVFHGAYIYSYLADPARRWAEHFGFAQAAAAHKIQHLGNEAGLPTLDDVRAAQRELVGEMANSSRTREWRIANSE